MIYFIFYKYSSLLNTAFGGWFVSFIWHARRLNYVIRIFDAFLTIFVNLLSS
jgi:hypothetical protein